jgi:hypothetical protein
MAVLWTRINSRAVSHSIKAIPASTMKILKLDLIAVKRFVLRLPWPAVTERTLVVLLQVQGHRRQSSSRLDDTKCSILLCFKFLFSL